MPGRCGVFAAADVVAVALLGRLDRAARPPPTLRGCSQSTFIRSSMCRRSVRSRECDRSQRRAVDAPTVLQLSFVMVVRRMRLRSGDSQPVRSRFGEASAFRSSISSVEARRKPHTWRAVVRLPRVLQVEVFELWKFRGGGLPRVTSQVLRASLAWFAVLCRAFNGWSFRSSNRRVRHDTSYLGCGTTSTPFCSRFRA